MDIDELVNKGREFLLEYRQRIDYLDIIKAQGTYETYTLMYIEIQESQYKREYSSNKKEEYQKYLTFFKDTHASFFENIEESFVGDKEVCLMIQFHQLYSRDINEYTNIGNTLGAYLKRYPNFTISIKDNSIIIKTFIDLYKEIKVCDKALILEEIGYRIETLRNS